MMEIPMHKSLNKSSLAGMTLALLMTPAIAAAQNDNAATAPTEAPPQAAQAAGDYDAKIQAWPAEKQAAFKAWPPETQTYYWSLSAERQKMFWALSDSDKVTLSKMAEPQRESTWAQIESRAAQLQG
jgi:hypothetical protein